MQKIKGNSLFIYKKFILERYGEKGLEDTLTKAGPKTKATFNKPIISNEWYDMEIFCDFLEAFDKTFGREEYKVLASFAAEKQISGVLGLVMRFITLESLMSRAQEQWEKYYTPGKMTAARKGPEVMITISEFEMTDLQSIGMMFYFKFIIEKLDKKEYISTIKKIDKKTVEFHFLKKH